MHQYEELKVWQKARELTRYVYEASRAFPIDERFGLQGQIRRASCSVMLNISEGAGRSGKKDFARFLDIAAGSNNEVHTAALIAADLSFLSKEQLALVKRKTTEISKMLFALKNSLGVHQQPTYWKDIEPEYKSPRTKY